MKAIFIQNDEALPYTPATAVAAGDVIVQGGIVGVAKRQIPANGFGALATRGVFNVPKGAEALTAGQLVYWDPVALAVTSVAGALQKFGRVVVDAALADTTARVMLIQTAAA